MVIELLDKLHESGDLKALFRAGVVSQSAINSRKIYHTYIDRINNNTPKGKSVRDTANVHNTSLKTVYTAIKNMEIKLK